ncbi:hypothetical protein NEMBOFW57_007026 [Staphylotrichum longicolle]|uniref:Mannan endo-1,6-alpha-mannosidase n=1 Tax=Staphylotrichum longicolle TaxID=669026 RepID=A0AAD4EUG1_9PEZI|nr:hypothetical protein NEMBOFW57_007026 [Staphylotrichum longicolle]
MYRATLSLLLAGAGSALAALQVDLTSSSSVKTAAKDLAFDVMSYYKGNQSGEIIGLIDREPPSGDYYWWNSAVLWSTMIDYWRYTGDDTYNTLAVEGITWQNGGKGNPFMLPNFTATAGNDDYGFWAMAAMQAVELDFPSAPQGQPGWLELAQGVFDFMVKRYSSEKACNGGLRWQVPPTNKGYEVKNTISNAVFLNLGARLARFTGNQTQGDWAEKTWTWLTTIGLIDGKSNVFDLTSTESNCTQINKLQTSYTAGVLLQAAAYMYNQTTDATQKTWQTRLTALADRTLAVFFARDGGVLSEISCEIGDKTTCTDDMRLFKGIALRTLASAAQMAPFLRDTVAPKLKSTAAAAVKACDGGLRGRECAFRWSDGDKGAAKLTGVREEMNALSAVLVGGEWDGGVRVRDGRERRGE